MAAGYKVTIFNGRIVSLIQTGDGKRWLHSKAKGVEASARRLAPKRSGRLAASHVTLPTQGTNQYHKRYRVSAQAYYAKWVHEGTGIYGPYGVPVRTGRLMRIPGPSPRILRRNRKGPTLVRSHRGQRSNPWLLRAAEPHF